ncbi:MAG TPA: cupin domain-containing protein [Gaiellaceae bacterium]|jgi:quercetin dioxygenase-like cupin family protein|nr:cupin domain-containing protein [Gaiellaceae bacterium]
MTNGYAVRHVDQLEELPINGGEFVWRPVRRHFGITAFGTNAYTADAGQRVVEEHFEKDGPEEMYVVLRGRATFTLGDDEVDAPAGTIVFAQPGTRRGAVAAENGTAVLAVGAKPGVAYEPSAWEGSFAAFSYAESGQLERAREEIAASIGEHPDAWQGRYNAACMEARFGDREAAIRHLQQAHELEPDEVAKLAARDSDLDALRDDARVSAIAGKAPAGGADA